MDIPLWIHQAFLVLIPDEPRLFLLHIPSRDTICLDSVMQELILMLQMIYWMRWDWAAFELFVFKKLEGSHEETANDERWAQWPRVRSNLANPTIVKPVDGNSSVSFSIYSLAQWDLMARNSRILIAIHPVDCQQWYHRYLTQIVHKGALSRAKPINITLWESLYPGYRNRIWRSGIGIVFSGGMIGPYVNESEKRDHIPKLRITRCFWCEPVIYMHIGCFVTKKTYQRVVCVRNKLDDWEMEVW